MYLNPSGVLNLSVNRVLAKIKQITVPLQNAATRLFGFYAQSLPFFQEYVLFFRTEPYKAFLAS